MAESAGSFLALSENSVIERDHVQTILNQMHENLEEGILSYGKLNFVNFFILYINIQTHLFPIIQFMCMENIFR